MAKTKLIHRIANAVRALRGEPWPAVIEGPNITYIRPATQTVNAETSCPLEFIDLQGPEVTDAAARRDIAALIGRELLEANAIELTRNVDLRAGLLIHRGRVRVVMPWEPDQPLMTYEEDDANG